MLVPIIKVRSRAYGSGNSNEHIVGSDSHDMLFIDDETGGIHYLNLQNEETSQKAFHGKPRRYYAYEFVGQESFCTPGMEIQFVDIEDFIKMAIDQMQNDAEKKEQLMMSLKKVKNTKKECNERIKSARYQTGIHIL